VEHDVIWGGDPEDILIRTSGPATVVELNAMVSEMLADPRFKPGLKVLLDHREAGFTGFTTPHIRSRADQAAWQLQQGRPSRVALVFGRDLYLVVGRLLESFISARTSIPICTFRTLDEARAWLRETPE
jgi:hypothetical protein